VALNLFGSGFKTQRGPVKFCQVKSKFLLPAIFVAIFATSRIPGLLPPNFSAAYAFAFCAGVYFPGALAWALPLGVMLMTDILLNVFYYHARPVGFYLLLNYAVYALLIGLGKGIGRKAPFLTLVLGGLAGAVLFYLVTNTLAWLQDAAYAKTITGWFQALTLGRPDWHPTTWEMFRNTLLSGGLFTALFAASEKLAAESPADKTAGSRAPATEAEEPGEPEESQT
jgi:hypothetical protein